MCPVVYLPTVLVRCDILLINGAGAVDIAHPVGDLGVLGVHEVALAVLTCHLDNKFWLIFPFITRNEGIIVFAFCTSEKFKEDNL